MDTYGKIFPPQSNDINKPSDDDFHDRRIRINETSNLSRFHTFPYVKAETKHMKIAFRQFSNFPVRSFPGELNGFSFYFAFSSP